MYKNRAAPGVTSGADPLARAATLLKNKNIENFLAAAKSKLALANLKTWIKRNRITLIGLTTILTGVSIFVGVQAFQIYNSTPKGFITSFIKSWEAKDVKALKNPDYFLDAASDVPVFDQSISSALQPDNLSEIAVISKTVQGKWNLALGQGRNYEVAPVDTINWGIVSRSWKILGLKSAEIEWSPGSLTDASQIVTLGSKTATVAQPTPQANAVNQVEYKGGAAAACSNFSAA
jgi:hypothetical protein